jgi:hypothetical protein
MLSFQGALDASQNVSLIYICTLPPFQTVSPSEFKLSISRVLSTILSSIRAYICNRGSSTIQLAFPTPTFQLDTHGYRLIASESFPHIHHASFAFAIAPFQLLTLCWESLDQW